MSHYSLDRHTATRVEATPGIRARRLTIAFFATVLATLSLLVASVAHAQGTMWVPVRQDAKPTPVVKKEAPARLKADSATKTPAADSTAIRLQQRIDVLEAMTREQTAAITALMARVEDVVRRDSVVPAPVADETSVVVAADPRSDVDSAVAAPAADTAAKDSAAAAPAAPTVEELARALEAMTRHVDSLQKEIGAVDKRSIQRVSGLGNFRFSGDVRMRYEPTFQAGGTVTRHRERTRARLNITGATGGELTGGISVTTGAFEEPATENQTHTGFFTRKTMAFERFFLTYAPKAVPGLSLTAGKFPTPWTRTPLTVSNDLFPEGVTGSYARPIRSGPVTELSVVGFWLPMLEVSGGPDSYLDGGQVQAKFRFGATRGAVSAAVIKAVNPDAIATGVVSGAFKPSWPTSNTLRTDSTGKVLGFAHGFYLHDYIVSAEQAFSPAWPVAISLNAVNNSMAAKGDRLGFMGEVKVGTTKGAGKAQFSATWYRIERDAVISAFNVTDIRLGSNAVGYITSAQWKLRSDLTAGFSGYFGRVLDPTKTPNLVASAFRSACKTAPFDGCRDPMWSRLQFDLIYSF